LAHEVGGLTDTVHHNKNGFTFTGDTPISQAENMLRCFEESIITIKQNGKKWKKIRENALNSRFVWKDVALDYCKYLYND
jgi:starch synthase